MRIGDGGRFEIKGGGEELVLFEGVDGEGAGGGGGGGADSFPARKVLATALSSKVAGPPLVTGDCGSRIGESGEFWIFDF